MAFRDLEEGILEEFAEAGEKGARTPRHEDSRVARHFHILANRARYREVDRALRAARARRPAYVIPMPPPDEPLTPCPMCGSTRVFPFGSTHGRHVGRMRPGCSGGSRRDLLTARDQSPQKTKAPEP